MAMLQQAVSPIDSPSGSPDNQIVRIGIANVPSLMGRMLEARSDQRILLELDGVRSGHVYLELDQKWVLKD